MLLLCGWLYGTEPWDNVCVRVRVFICDHYKVKFVPNNWPKHIMGQKYFVNSLKLNFSLGTHLFSIWLVRFTFFSLCNSIKAISNTRWAPWLVPIHFEHVLQTHRNTHAQHNMYVMYSIRTNRHDWIFIFRLRNRWEYNNYYRSEGKRGAGMHFRKIENSISP